MLSDSALPVTITSIRFPKLGNLLKTELLYLKDTDIKGTLRKNYKTFNFLLIIFNSPNTSNAYNRTYSTIIPTRFIADYNKKYNSLPQICIGGNESSDGRPECSEINFTSDTTFTEINEILIIYGY